MKAGDRVRIARSSAGQFQDKAMRRVGTVRRVRQDGLVVVKWDGLTSEQILSTSHLEIDCT